MPTPDFLAPDWPAPRNVRAWTTTRAGGYSRPPYAEFNLAEHVGDDPECVAANRRRLHETLELPGEPAWLRQVHGAAVLALPDAGELEADAAWTSRPGQVCAVLTADCLPVLFCDRAGSRVAAAHAGWRGLAAGVLEATARALEVPPAGLLAWLGPAIGPRAFEVGEEVRAVFVADDPAAAGAFAAGRAGHWFADIYALARLRLARAGVGAVYGGGLCTYREAERFYSYRRERATGRMASLIWLDGHD